MRPSKLLLFAWASGVFSVLPSSKMFVLMAEAQAPVRPGDTRSAEAGSQPPQTSSTGANVGAESVGNSSSPSTGMSADVKAVSTEVKKLDYQPLNSDFWDKIQKSRAIGNSIKALMLSVEYTEKTVKGLKEDEAEGRLAMGIALEDLHFTFAANAIFIDLVRKNLGTQVSLEALRGLSRLALAYPYDKLEIGEDLVTSIEFGNLPVEIRPFIGFHLGLNNLQNGFKQWSDLNFQTVDQQSQWWTELEYLKALGDIARDKVADGRNRLTALAANENAPMRVRKNSRHQIARLTFEDAKYDEAEQLLADLDDMPLRTRARVETERAWIRYYKKDFSKALGHVEVLASPLFRDFRPLESYVVQLLIYKELCYYDKVSEIAADFRSVYKSTLEDIRKRKPFRKSKALAKLALLNDRHQYWANYIELLREERKRLEDLDWSEFGFYRPLVDAYKSKEAEVITRQTPEIEAEAESIAEQLLDTEEQVAFLDYSARMDALRIRDQRTTRMYEPERISYVNFDKMFWPISDEIWKDELPDYKVLVSSQCEGTTVESIRPTDPEFQ
ncbi:MAG: hypothetical protein K2X47_04165 [Bdellovibrionales bacterium]|nr:hypothetical protein [Bdellovibrionales bacterium]